MSPPLHQEAELMKALFQSKIPTTFSLSKRETLTRLMVAIVSATAGVTSSDTVAHAGHTNFVLVQVNEQALFFNQMNEGALAAAHEAGAELVIFNAKNDSSAQNSAIETYVSEGVSEQESVDGLIVVAIDVKGILPAVERAYAAGIPVVAVDAILPEEGRQDAQVTVDNNQAGVDMAAYVNEFASRTDGGLRLGVVGALNSFNQNIRKDGFVDALDGVEVIATVNGENTQDSALSAAEKLITANPEMNAIYATGEPALLGTLAAVESQERQDSITVFGWNLTEQVINGIDAGYIGAVVQQNAAGMGAAAVDALLDLNSGNPVEMQIDVPYTIVNKSNVDDFRDKFK